MFDELIPLQYSDEDRERGYFVGQGPPRRGPYQVPLMTLSIGVVTNEHRNFVHTAQISELATEMKAYAKTFAGLDLRRRPPYRPAPGAAPPDGDVPQVAPERGRPAAARVSEAAGPRGSHPVAAPAVARSGAARSLFAPAFPLTERRRPANAYGPLT